LFALARQLKKTVAELETGIPQPLSETEFQEWLIFWRIEKETADEHVVQAEADRRSQAKVAELKRDKRPRAMGG